jgi:hypothetical protein
MVGRVTGVPLYINITGNSINSDLREKKSKNAFPKMVESKNY